MDAIEILICDSLADSLSKHVFPGAITQIDAVRRIVPDEATESLGELQVSVVPGELDVSNHTHGADLFEATVHVVIAKRFDTPAELDALYDLRSNVVDAIRSKVLPVSSPPMPKGTSWYSIQNVVTFGRDQVTNMSTFLADVAVVYRRAQEKVL